MKKAFLLIVVPVLLVALGFAQTPAPSDNPDQTTIKGCLGGSDPNYTVVEDNAGNVFTITTSSVDLKPHLGHDVTLIGHKPGATNSTPADNSLAVTALNMISEHCATEAAAPAAIVTTPAETAGAPADTTPPAATVTTPAETASTPAVVDTPPAEMAVTPPPSADVPVATISTPAETVVTPAARPRKRSETPAATTTTPAVIASTPAATAVVPMATDTSSAQPASTPAAVPTTPTPASKGWSLWLLIAFGVLVVVMGVMFPFVSRWRKQKNLEQTDAPNLSFNREASSAGNKPGQSKPDQGKSDEQQPRKAA